MAGNPLRRPVPDVLRTDMKETTSTATDYTVSGDDEVVEVDTSSSPVTITSRRI